MIEVHPDGRVSFAVCLPRAESVAVAGDFTDWSASAVPMRRAPDGWWRLELRIAPGEHQFQYLIDGHRWLADFAAHGVSRNGFGAWVSGLVVGREGLSLPEAA